MRFKFLTILLVILSAGASLAQKPITLEELIPPAEQKKMGLQKLSPKEKELLRQAILQRMTNAYQAGLVKGQNARVPAPGVRGPKVYAGVGGGHWVKQNIDHGSMILLEDGSLWEVQSLERIDAGLWLAASSVTVLEVSDGMPGYNYLLVNADERQKVHAKYLGNK